MPIFLQEYSTHDKSEWGDGPWNDEPDKAVWIDEETDLDCMFIRNHSGALCGYVGLPPGHPWHGMGYSECDNADCDDEFCYEHGPSGVSVHGGLTFAGGCGEGGDPADTICHIPQPGRPDHVWWFGFDCIHSGDIGPAMEARSRQYGLGDAPGEYRDVAYVMAEVASLAAQCKAVG